MPSYGSTRSPDVAVVERFEGRRGTSGEQSLTRTEHYGVDQSFIANSTDGYAQALAWRLSMPPARRCISVREEPGPTERG